MFSLLGLCALACILLIVVIVSTGGKFNIKQLLHKGENNRAAIEAVTRSMPPEDHILIPERFKDIDTTAAAVLDTPSATPEPAVTEIPPVPPRPNVQRYFATFPCNQMITGNDLRLLLSDNNLFCQKSPWSQAWANPTGKGIRRKKEGLLFTDSTVIDSFTNLVWQRYAPLKLHSYSTAELFIAELNRTAWQGYSTWRIPKIEELMATFTPQKNQSGLHLPQGWNCKAKDMWSCNSAIDSLNTRWVWVARTALGRCNIGHPDTLRSLLAVHDMQP